jgi:protein tyrosine phosphatase (PTP) superfamily phosphohydrolase (DUF442 family)
MTGFGNPLDSLQNIRAFQLVSDSLASSGYVMDDQFDLIHNFGFRHVISLLPGKQGREDSIVTSLGMSFTHIPVDFGKPTMKDLEAYLEDMAKHKEDMVFLHCQANMKASVFMYLYRVTQLGTDKQTAKDRMFEIWYPTGDWHSLIEKGLERYGFDPEYRYEPDFIILVRREGIEAANVELSRLQSASEELPFMEIDLRRLADEYEEERKSGLAIQVHRLNARAFPDSWRIHDKLGGLLIQSPDEEGAGKSYLRALELNPDHVWAKRMLGKLGMEKYMAFWVGKDLDPNVVMSLEGIYDLGDARLEFYMKEGKFFFRPSWGKRTYRIYANSPYRYFVQENNWMIEFTGGTLASVKFITDRRTFRGNKIE